MSNLSEKQMIELANKIADRLFFMSGVNEVAHELIPARTVHDSGYHRADSKQFAGGYSHSEFVREVIQAMKE